MADQKKFPYRSKFPDSSETARNHQCGYLTIDFLGDFAGGDGFWRMGEPEEPVVSLPF